MRRLLILLAVGTWLATGVEGGSTIFLVRHAEKSNATPGDKDPGLTVAGMTRAERLATLLKGARITAIFATEFKRTQLTAQPLAQALKLQVTVIKAGDLDALAKSLQQSKGNILVVGHSNTVPELIKRLGVAIPIEIGENDYDHLYAVTIGDRPQLTHSRY